MRLGTKGRYAVTALVDISRQCAQDGTDKPVSLASIAARQEISLSYLEQLFSKLGKRGLVKSMRGPGGGFCLAKSAEEILISDIVDAADEPIRTTNCNNDPNQGCRSDKSRCLTHHLWEELGEVIHDYLSSVTLADVVNGKLSGVNGCIEKQDLKFIPMQKEKLVNA
ncbi:MAG: Rrf2 family transcriptional regulator [Alphaproteobacteria bacterium]|nr:MAG: Rrf2 family transcriptional regulator [Alphaproteobacteria bacterium]